MTEKHQHLECPNCGKPFVSAFKKEEGSLLYCCVCTPRLREVNWQRKRQGLMGYFLGGKVLMSLWWCTRVCRPALTFAKL